MKTNDQLAVVAIQINKRFGRLKALNDLTVEIPKGTTYCLLGPNGSGKTTFIRAIAGLLRLDSGELHVLDHPVKDIQRISHRVGYMTQHKALYPDLTLQENMEFYGGLYGIRGKALTSRMDELLEMVDLMEHKGRLAGDLSGGMYQRLSLACTLIHKPDLLLLDEPTVGVDPLLRQVFWDYFNKLTDEGVTIIITTHLMDEAERCKIVGFMRAGKMIAQSSPADLKRLAGLKPRLTLWVEDQTAALGRLAEIGFDVETVGDKLQISLEHHNDLKKILNIVKIDDLLLEEPSLDQAFLRLSQHVDITNLKVTDNRTLSKTQGQAGRDLKPEPQSPDEDITGKS